MGGNGWRVRVMCGSDGGDVGHCATPCVCIVYALYINVLAMRLCCRDFLGFSGVMSLNIFCGKVGGYSMDISTGERICK